MGDARSGRTVWSGERRREAGSMCFCGQTGGQSPDPAQSSVQLRLPTRTVRPGWTML